MFDPEAVFPPYRTKEVVKGLHHIHEYGYISSVSQS
jgi:hypothetical protein